MPRYVSWNLISAYEDDENNIKHVSHSQNSFDHLYSWIDEEINHGKAREIDSLISL